MTNPRSRTAVPALRRHAGASSRVLPSVDGLVASLMPNEPLYAIRPATLRATARHIVDAFAGDVLYAVKCNPEPSVLRALWDGGIRHFDCASIGEIRLVRQLLPAASIHYMHPIKSEQAIREAYEQWGVRDFSLDHMLELEKIVAVADGGALGLHVRLAMPKSRARYDLSGKFGADHESAVALLRAARAVATKIGVCFHVGSQCMVPDAYAEAVRLAATVVRDAGIAIDLLDIGGGFPGAYADMTPAPIAAFFAAAEAAMEGFGPVRPRLWCEPGRALVAAGASVIAKIEARRDGILHLNDGVFGNLYDARGEGLRFPVRAIRLPDGGQSAALGNDLLPFSFYGPSCDSEDYMAGPFMLPADIGPGDWIEIGQTGAYGACLRTAFNGFDRTLFAQVSDPAFAVASVIPNGDCLARAA